MSAVFFLTQAVTSWTSEQIHIPAFCRQVVAQYGHLLIKVSLKGKKMKMLHIGPFKLGGTVWYCRLKTKKKQNTYALNLIAITCQNNSHHCPCTWVKGSCTRGRPGPRLARRSPAVASPSQRNLRFRCSPAGWRGKKATLQVMICMISGRG